MIIAHVINNLEQAGAEGLLRDTMLGMLGRGHECHVVTLFHYTNPILHDSLLEAGASVHDLGFGFRYDPRIRGHLRRTLTDIQPQIVHAHLFPALYWTALAAPAGAARVVTEHSSMNWRRRHRLLHGIDRRIYARYDHIICISDTVRRAFLRAHPALADRTSTIHNGIVPARCAHAPPADRASLGVPPDAPAAVMVARLGPPKDQATVVRAVAAVPGMHLVLAGSGPAYNALHSLASRLGTGDRVHFLGHRADVPGVLKACDICVHSSKHEGFCLAAVEAMACGVPVVMSRIDAADEVLGPDAGELFAPGDHAALTQSLLTLSRDERRRERMRIAGRERAARFSIDTTVDSLLTLYHSRARQHRDTR